MESTAEEPEATRSSKGGDRLRQEGSWGRRSSLGLLGGSMTMRKRMELIAYNRYLPKPIRAFVVMVAVQKRHWLVQWKYLIAAALVYCLFTSTFSMGEQTRLASLPLLMQILTSLIASISLESAAV